MGSTWTNSSRKIYYSTDAEKPHMGMLSFKGENPNQSDALVAKNYCNKEKLSALNSVVSAYSILGNKPNLVRENLLILSIATVLRHFKHLQKLQLLQLHLRSFC